MWPTKRNMKNLAKSASTSVATKTTLVTLPWRIDRVLLRRTQWSVISLTIKVTLKLDLLKTVLKLARVKCKQMPPCWRWRILISLDCILVPCVSVTYRHPQFVPKLVSLLWEPLYTDGVSFNFSILGLWKILSNVTEKGKPFNSLLQLKRARVLFLNGQKC